MAIACTGFTYTYFGEAFPITSLSISADQHAARLAAQELRVQLNASGAWARPVEPPRVASAFKLDQDCQHFVELRGGGNAAFSQMLSGGLYAPFTWRVRHFLPADAAGTVYLLTPSGVPFGFTTTLPEEEEGANLTSAEALSVARLAASGAPWAVDFGVWSLVEEKKEARPRRTDHTFTFERPERVGEAGVDASESQQATYRLELAVRGARLASLRRSFKVPEAFSREFEGMRSANEAIAQLAWIGIVVLYGVGGVAMGSWLLMRRNARAAASAAPWSVVLAGGMGGAMGVQMPLQWMSYATELEVGVFQLDYGVKVAVQSAFFLAIVFLSFVAAEGLGRVAFPNQLRLWALMRRPVLQSRTLLDQVLLGYLLVPVMFAYEVGFYFCCKHLLGWWMPSSPLADPDVNATLAPWLPPIAQALFAGFWEEALFRAVPLAATALCTASAGLRVAEDEAAVRGIAAKLLRQRGYEVIEAADGEEALVLAEQYAGTIDMLISDVIMPGLDGPSLLRKARKYLGDAPVMFISGYAESDFSDLLQDEANVSFLPKPLDIKTLAERVKQELRTD